MLYLILFLGFMFFGGVAMTVGEGVWSNTVLFFVVTLSGLLGVFVGVPLGLLLMEQMDKAGEFAWYFVFAGMWLTFVLSVTLMRLLVDKGSKVRVRFIPQVEAVGGPLVGLLVAVMFVSFATFTLTRVPFQAGVWDLSSASDWQKSTLAYARAPFRVVVKGFAEAEGVDDPFLGS